MKCLNCQSSIEGNYCHNCGQKKNISRLTVSSITSSTLDSLFNLKNGFIFTIIELFKIPWVVINSYIIGKRKAYYNPFKLTILLTTISNILLIKIMQYGTYKPLNSLTIKIDGELVFNLTNYWDSLTLLMIPIFSITSFILYRKKEFNYAEHLALNAYLVGFQALINIIYFSIFLLIDPTMAIPGIPYLIGLVFISITSIKFFKISIIEGIIKSVIIFMISYAIFAQLLEFSNSLLYFYFDYKYG